jgi:hypothetical protein
MNAGCGAHELLLDGILSPQGGPWFGEEWETGVLSLGRLGWVIVSSSRTLTMS